MSDPADLERRLAEVEARIEIGSLPSRYARAVDSRDLDGLVALFVPDVAVGDGRRGRDALREVMTQDLQRFYRSIHSVGRHVVDTLDGERATGTTYGRTEHEERGRWVRMAYVYLDTYERRDGRWLFAQRRLRHWYIADALRDPTEVGFDDRPDVDRLPPLPGAFPTWAPFWEGVDAPTDRPA